MSTVANSLTFRLFIGFPITSELKMELNRNAKWKEAEITLQKSLEKVPFDDKEYIGRYLESPILALKDLPALEESLYADFKSLFPEFKQERLSLRLFSQPFIH
jgi:hypothetical protein